MCALFLVIYQLEIAVVNRYLTGNRPIYMTWSSCFPIHGRCLDPEIFQNCTWKYKKVDKFKIFMQFTIDFNKKIGNIQNRFGENRIVLVIHSQIFFVFFAF